jgi:hypothetical protein
LNVGCLCDSIAHLCGQCSKPGNALFMKVFGFMGCECKKTFLNKLD